MFTNPFLADNFVCVHFNILNFKCIKLFKDIGKFCHPTESRKSIRMFLRSLYWAKHSYAWFHFIANHPLLARLVLIERNLPEKIHRQILRTDYPIARRLQLLTEHYNLIDKLLDSDLLINALLKTDGAQLSKIEISPEQQFFLQLGYGIYPAKEGELSITMLDIKSTILARLSFSVMPSSSGHIIYIAGLQGATGTNARESVSTASKACCGLAPKRIVMEVLFAIAHYTQAEKILGVPDKLHVSKKLTKQFNYDDYWREFDAVINTDGTSFYHLFPNIKITLKPQENVAQNIAGNMSY